MRLKNLPKAALVLAIQAYRYTLSPYLGRVCRFEPSCSIYGLEAVQTHGAAVGAVLAVARICRCNPWNHGGFDPVPATDAVSAYQFAPKHLFSTLFKKSTVI